MWIDELQLALEVLFDMYSLTATIKTISNGIITMSDGCKFDIKDLIKGKGD